MSAACVGEARADGAAECLRGSEEGLAARDHGRLREARKRFVSCAADACPKSLRIDCARWLEEVEASLPTVAFGAKDARGADLFDVSVYVDGERVLGHEQGKAIALDPGPHTVRFERPGAKPVEERVLLRAGERNRSIIGSFTADAEPKARSLTTEQKTPDVLPPSRSGSGVPVISLALGGVGLAALGGFTFFALTGQRERTRLEEACSPGCTDAQIDGLKTRYILADVSLGVGIVALGLAAYFWLRESH
jgi:hypothetical protein